VINLEELSDEIRVLVAPLRPYACVFYYSAGAHRSIIGHYQYFETNQAQQGGVMNHMQDMGI